MHMENQNELNTRAIRSITSLFEKNFSIDWVIELSQKKPSEVLLALETGITEGWAKRTDIGWYRYTASKKNLTSPLYNNALEKDIFYSKIAALIVNGLSGIDHEVMNLSKFLQDIDNDETGCRALLYAGDAYARNSQPDQALRCYSKIKNDLKHLKSDAADALFIDIAIKYSKLSTGLEHTTEVLDTLDHAHARALATGNVAARSLIQMHIAKNQWLLNDYDSALVNFKKGWDLAVSCNDEKLMNSATTLRTFFLFWQGRFKEVLIHYENAISDIDKNPSGGFPLLATITVGQCYIYSGQISQGLGMIDNSCAICRKEGDLFTEAYALATINTTLECISTTDAVLKNIDQTYPGIHQSRNQYIEMLTDGSLAYFHYLKGNIPVSISFLKKFVQKCRSVNVATLHHRPYLLAICWAMRQGLYPQLLDLSLEKEVDTLLSSQNVFLKGLAYRYKALLEIRSNEPFETIMTSLNLSLKFLETSGNELEKIRTQFEIIRQYIAGGDQIKARELAQKISVLLDQYSDDIIPTDLMPLVKKKPSPEYLAKEIMQLGRELMDMKGNNALVRKIISEVNRITGAERGAIFQWDDTSDTPGLKLRASKNLSQDQIHHSSFAASMKLIERTAKNMPYQIQYQRSENNTEEMADRFSLNQIQFLLCVPMVYKQKLVGVMYHDNRLLNSDFEESDFEPLFFFASLAAMALENANAHEEIIRLNEKINDEIQDPEPKHHHHGQFKDIIGKSSTISRMLTLVDQVSQLNTNVLILGETGVGKELVANAIHFHGSRKSGPFIKANCSALTETLINSELFGHEKGAYTGADSRRIGRFEMADSGTLFLDEIGDLPLDVQVNLLRVIQNSEFERVGGNQTIYSDFRLITATNHNLESLVKEKKFREDLYFRLNVFPIFVPPLRDRKEDIPLLVHHFMSLFCEKMNKPVKKIAAAEMNKLMQHDWPGNVRELENIIEKGVILSTGKSFKAPELSVHSDAYKRQHQALTLAENERNHILWAMALKNWKVRGPGGAAEFLDVHPSTLAARMKKLNIRRPQKN